MTNLRQWTRTYPTGHVGHIVTTDQSTFLLVVWPPHSPMDGSLHVDAAESLTAAKAKADSSAGHVTDDSAWTDSAISD
jgi:hypothetical protein